MYSDLMWFVFNVYRKAEEKLFIITECVIIAELCS
jgi:hypothetical protein